MSRVMVVGNEYLAIGAPVFLDDILLNLARKRKLKFFGTAVTIGKEWRFTINPVEALQQFAFSTENCIKINSLPPCMLIVNIEESEELRGSLQEARHTVEVVLYSY